MEKIIFSSIILGALISTIWLFYFFIKQFKKIYLPDNTMHIFKIAFFAVATIQSWMLDTVLIKFLFFEGKSKFIFFLDLIFVLFFGYLFMKAIWASTVPKAKNLKNYKIFSLIFYTLYLFGMIKVTYF